MEDERCCLHTAATIKRGEAEEGAAAFDVLSVALTIQFDWISISRLAWVISRCNLPLFSFFTQTHSSSHVSAVIQGLRGDKGEPGNPGLPGFSGPKGPPVSAGFDIY